jgi:hypothetical protein
MEEMVFVLRNDHETMMKLVVEPWGESYEIPPRHCASVRLTGPMPGHLVTESRTSELVLHGWTGSVLGAVTVSPT